SRPSSAGGSRATSTGPLRFHPDHRLTRRSDGEVDRAVRSHPIPVRTFDRNSPVTAYWLTRCEGFRVRSPRRRGVVEDVALDPATWHASFLVVRYRGLGRRRVVPAERVDSVGPAPELLVLRSPGRPA